MSLPLLSYEELKELRDTYYVFFVKQRYKVGGCGIGVNCAVIMVYDYYTLQRLQKEYPHEYIKYVLVNIANPVVN